MMKFPIYGKIKKMFQTTNQKIMERHSHGPNNLNNLKYLPATMECVIVNRSGIII